MICPNCGKEISDSAVMCWRCGRAVPPRAGEAAYHAQQTPPSYETPGGDDWYQPQPPVQEYAGPEVPPPARKSPKKLLIGICIAIVAVAVIAVLIGVFAGMRTDGVVTIGTSQGFATHQELIQAYCDYYSAADESGMVTLYPEALRDQYDGYGGASRLLDDWDSFYDFYGEQVDHWMISDIVEYEPSDYSELASDLGVAIESAADVEVTMWLEDSDEPFCYDFDLIEIDGAWFLFNVW